MAKKNIIISGPMASGKTYIAEAIAITHQNVLIVRACDVEKKLQKNKFPHNLSDQYSLMIIDECVTEGQILILNDILTQFRNYDIYTREPIPQAKSKPITIVYLTLDEVTLSRLRHGDFHIIKANYHQFKGPFI